MFLQDMCCDANNLYRLENNEKSLIVVCYGLFNFYRDLFEN
ncbi:hypothetical protein J699_00118 [Acinetobacter sp. 1000160]|nr:hypothetical protein J699_00118 [Acinetobacter sp. 1000160]